MFNNFWDSLFSWFNVTVGASVLSFASNAFFGAFQNLLDALGGFFG